ncbi:MAG: hypothetical protein EXQ94_14795 [Alphaproteobacteria bacterium]|nr:hypothetical protein [Alphaproteobacteria bacterium]
MIAGQIIGWVLLIAAVTVLAIDVVPSLGEAPFIATSVGEAWASVNANSLVGFGAIVENRVDPDLWTEVILPILVWPLAAVLGVPGLVLVILCRSRRGRTGLERRRR